MNEILCVLFKSEISISPNPLGLPKVSVTGLLSQMLWALIFPVQDCYAGEPEVGLRPLTPLGEPLQYNYSPVCGSPTMDMGLNYIASLPLLPFLL